MKDLDFYKLTRPVQERFMGSVSGQFAPVPILSARGATPAPLIWLGVSFTSSVGLFVLYRVGLGDLQSSLAAHSPVVIAGYIGLAAVSALGIAQAFTLWVRRRALPFACGVYAFPMSVVDARRGNKIRVHAMADLTTTEGPVGSSPATFRLVFPGASFSFQVPGEHALSASTALTEAREQVKHALSEGAEDPALMLELDPLHEPRFSSPVGPRDSLVPVRSPFVNFAWAIALFLGVLIGPSVWALRNNKSDERMFAEATVLNTEEGYKNYLARGQRHTEEVSQILLPRVELHAAEKLGTVEGIQKYIAAHPSSKIQPEVSAALRVAMIAALEKAKSEHTLVALKEFAKAHPDHNLEPQLQKAMHAVYEAALTAYRAQATGKDKSAIAFMERLVAFAEKKGPKVEIRLRHKTSRLLPKADGHIMRLPSFMGKVSYPTGYFDLAHNQVREAALAKALIIRFSEAFPQELVTFEVGAPLPIDEPLPEPTVPTLFITDECDWGGQTYPTMNPRGILVGLNFGFDAAFVLPADPKPVKIRFDVFRVPDPTLFRESVRAPNELAPEEKVYEAMAKKSFEQFQGKVLATFLKSADNK